MQDQPNPQDRSVTVTPKQRDALLYAVDWAIETEVDMNTPAEFVAAIDKLDAEIRMWRSLEPPQEDEYWVNATPRELDQRHHRRAGPRSQPGPGCRGGTSVGRWFHCSPTSRPSRSKRHRCKDCRRQQVLSHIVRFVTNPPLIEVLRSSLFAERRALLVQAVGRLTR
jgi:hypothetical protein